MPLSPGARDSITLIREAKEVLDRNDLASFYALETAARAQLLVSRPHLNDDEDDDNYYWILVAAGDRMRQAYVGFARRMLDDFCSNPYLDC
jgi:hypothetical protein